MSCSKQQSITTISDLPDECLYAIFRNIRISVTAGKSFVSLRTVCKRWTTLIDDCWREIKEINFIIRPVLFNVIHDSHRLVVITNNQSTRGKADKFIEHCGLYLKALSVGGMSLSTCTIIPLVAKTCENLEKYTGSVLTRTDSKHLRDLLDACTKLKVLRINIVAGKIYSFFQRIPIHQLQELCIHTHGICDPLLPKYIKETIRHCQVLTKLSLDYIDTDFVSLLTNLQELHIGSMGPLELAPSRASPLINNEFLVSLSDTCLQLKSITLGRCINLTDEGISVLSRLPKLMNLNLWELPKITGKCFNKFDKIDKLQVLDCSVGDAEIIALLKNSPTLRILNVGGSNITDATLAFAVEETKKRKSNITLVILCHLTNTNPERFQGAYPLLKISQAFPEMT